MTMSGLYSDHPLEKIELNSVRALLAWVAYDQHVEEERVRAITCARFDVPEVTTLPRKSFDEVVRFLVDLRLDQMH